MMARPARKINKDGTLQCTKCEVTQPTWRFPVARARKTGHASWCSNCQARYHEVNKERAHANMKRNHFKRKYGMTLEEVIELGKEQDNKCPICTQQLVYEKYGYAVDHDHVTDEVRGILCFNCNRSLGGFKDDPVVLRAAADYLEARKCHSE
jgi:peroxiredoxin family protein